MQCGESMKPLFTSFFCPNDCDRGGSTIKSTTFLWKGKTFRVARVKKLQPFPAWVVYAWALFKGHEGREDGEASFDDLMQSWREYEPEPYEDYPGWTLAHQGVDPKQGLQFEAGGLVFSAALD